MDITGKNICITGMLQKYTRSEIEQVIEQLGGTLKKNMSSKVDYFIITADCLLEHDKTGTDKIAKWLNGKVPIITEYDFYALIGTPCSEIDKHNLVQKYRRAIQKTSMKTIAQTLSNLL